MNGGASQGAVALLGLAISTSLSTPVMAGGGGFGFNEGNFANGAAAASGTVNVDGGSVENVSQSETVATLGPDSECGCTGSVIAADRSGAANSVTVVGGKGEIQSSTIAISQAGVGNGSSGYGSGK